MSALKKLARFFLPRACRPGTGRTWGNITVCLLDDRGMRAANRGHFSIDDTTDVISVAYDPLPGETGQQDADVMVNVECALRDAERQASARRGIGSRWTGSHELAFYLAHGLDHLCGSDDATPVDRRSMHRREKGWVRDAEADGLLAALIQPGPRKG